MPFTQAPEHYTPLSNPLPDWLGQVSPKRQQALKQPNGALSAPIKAATPAQHAQMQALIAGYMKAQNAIDQQLEHLQDAKAFAEPILKQALSSRFGQDLDVRSTYLRLYVPVTTPGFPIQTGARTWTVSLLDAALHNFEARETEDSAFEADSSFISQPNETGQFDTLTQVNARIGIPAFTALCRELDIGSRYTTYLEDNLGVSNPTVAETLPAQIKTSQEGALRVALQLARMNGDISEDYWRVIGGLLDGVQGLRMDGQPVLCHDFSMMSAALPGVLVFAPDLEQARASVSVVAYVPDDPDHPIKQYSSTAEMMQTLTRQLRTPAYQRFFSRFVAHEQRGFFFADLSRRLAKVTWHPVARGSALPAWRDTPIEQPNLQFRATPISGDLWQHLYTRKLDRILNDAAVIAVPTATVDRNARWAVWDSLVKVAAAILEVAAFVVAPFVPFLGEMLMAYMTYQALNELFEGVIEWTQGQTTEAAEHLWSVLESLVQLGAFGAGGAVALGELPKVLPAKTLAFIDRFKAVTLRNGKTLYWTPDLERYKRPPPTHSGRTDHLGLLRHNGAQLLPIERAHFAVSPSDLPGRYRIEHPTRPDAYQPQVFHNGDGAWHTELEQPLTWDSHTVLRRLGHRVDGFSMAEREQVLKISGYSVDGLRKMHVNREPMPPLLADSITRLQIDQQLQRGIDQLSSPHPRQYLTADPLLQLQWLQRGGLWPEARRLRFVDERGETLWQSTADATRPVTLIKRQRLADGDVLKQVLQALSENEIKAMLGEEFAVTPTLEARARLLRAKLAQLAQTQRTALFEAHYRAAEKIEDPLQQRIADHAPQLPTSLTRELRHTATGAQLLEIDQGRWPQAQQDLVALADQELRVSRAYEGLELASVRNPETDTLALHSLARLSGWSKDLRLEIHDQTFGATLLDSSGPVQASVKKILVRKGIDRYQPYDKEGLELYAPTDFYTCVLQALPDAERQALGMQIGEAAKLKQAVRDNPLPRDALRVAMAPDALRPPAVDTLRLLGMDAYPAIPEQAPRTLEQQIREVYPGTSREELDWLTDQLQRHPAGAQTVLARLREEYARLDTDLAQWITDTPGLDPSHRRALAPNLYAAARQNRALFAQRLKACWRRELQGPSRNKLSFQEPIPGDLPVLRAGFNHVYALELNGSPGSGGVETFLPLFAQLLRLDLRNFSLAQLPAQLATMPRLRQLRLRHCGLTLTPSSQAALSSLSRLTTLDLHGNPLGLSPNLQSMPALTHLRLENTGISALPNGLLGHPRLQTINLSHNQITSLPDALFELDPHATDRMNFAHNPLSQPTRERIKAYYTQTGRYFWVLPEASDIYRTRALFPDLNELQASGLIYNLPGSLLQGRIQITQWETELFQLTSDLARWTRQLPEPNPLNGEAFTASEQLAEMAARDAFATQLENLWRTRSTTAPYARANTFVTNLRFMGELPVPAANFDHIASLTLIGSRVARTTPALFQRFPHLRTLQLNNFALEQLPQTLGQLPQLTSLTLNQCGVTITPPIQARLAALHNLESLSLPNNPLGIAPDTTPMARLNYLDLSNANLSQVPDGLTNHPHLKTVIISHNQITSLPDAFYALPARKSRGFDFSNNPLTANTRERIKTYSRETGQDFGVAADLADIEATQTLFPALDMEEASDVFYALPGSLEQGRRQLRHWKAEIQLLSETLTRWKADIPEYHPSSGESLGVAQTLAESLARNAFADQLIALWRARSPEAPKQRETVLLINAPFMGDLPALSVDFSHISSLALHGNPLLGAVPTFLESFSGLRHLGLQNTLLNQVPPAVTRMTSLESLLLNRCAVSLTAQSQSILSPLARLQVLDLSNNPLGLAPSLEGLSALKKLSVSNTGISTVPDNLAEHLPLDAALFNDNQISELPDSLFSTADTGLSGFNFANNPLSTASREKIKTYYERTALHLGVPMAQTDIQRAVGLFPSLTEQDANTLLYQLPGTLVEGQAQLTRWETEVRQLTEDLEPWANAVPEQHPATGLSLSERERAAQLRQRKDLREKLERFWRTRSSGDPLSRPNGLSLDLPHIGDMPALRADFGFLSALVFHGNRHLRVSDQFLRCFPNLKILEMRNLALDRVPQALADMPALEHVVLSNCAVVLDADSQAVLFTLRNLSSLELDQNPLGRTPDIRNLSHLTYLDLANTGISDIPHGPTRLGLLDVGRFTDNQIREIPDPLFELPTTATNGLDFANNPLNAATRDRIKAYYRHSGEDFGVPAEPADLARVQTLHPNLDNLEASTYFYSLPGTLAEGRNELTRLEAELSDLTRELTQWAGAVPDDPHTGQPLDAAERAIQETHRDQFKEELLTAWRKRPTESSSINDFELSWTLPLLGELPTLSVDFKHVLSLILINNSATAPRLGRFLEAFPNLDSLTLQRYDLAELPEVIIRLHQLKELNLPDCGVRLTPSSAGKLSEMTRLEVLNLRNNPLGLTPDLSNLQSLESLNLTNTGITAIPGGVLNNHQVHSVYLADNQISEMPDTLMQVPDAVGAHYNLRNNPFSAQSLDIIRAYYHVTGNTLNVQGIATAPGVPPLPVED